MRVFGLKPRHKILLIKAESNNNNETQSLFFQGRKDDVEKGSEPELPLHVDQAQPQESPQQNVQIDDHQEKPVSELSDQPNHQGRTDTSDSTSSTTGSYSIKQFCLS